ncbi:MAG TPA: tetratricopeptide repeat protein [Tepidisphaeraceae bacterium]|nr:tetratricopeptide repeat protein [Tepidisphaeraceae bacterium]
MPLDPPKHRRVIPFLIIVVTLAAAAPQSADELAAAARAELRSGDTDRALDLANEAVKTDPNGTSGYMVRAEVHDVRREIEKAVADYDRVIAHRADFAPARYGRATSLFRLGRFKESVADFDRLVELDPAREPHLWERGIALYYAGEFERGARQFDVHRAVNPDDVENAAWHYLCVARASGVEAARRLLIPVSRDGRVPMMKVHDLYAGKATPSDVLSLAEAEGGSAVPEGERKRRLFYAHLYVGLHYDAAGETEEAAKHIDSAAGKYADNNYMGDVARVHARVLADRRKGRAKEIKKTRRPLLKEGGTFNGDRGTPGFTVTR